MAYLPSLSFQEFKTFLIQENRPSIRGYVLEIIFLELLTTQACLSLEADIFLNCKERQWVRDLCPLVAPLGGGSRSHRTCGSGHSSASPDSEAPCTSGLLLALSVEQLLRFSSTACLGSTEPLVKVGPGSVPASPPENLWCETPPCAPHCVSHS
jgi:hypothetical protein